MLSLGDGPPLLFLHAGEYFEQCLPWLKTLSSTYNVIAPRHPGFGKSALPKDFRSVDDLCYFYLCLMKELDLHDVTLVGSSFGGWIALEIGVRDLSRLKAVVLLDSLGVKLCEPNEREIADIYATNEDDLIKLTFADPGNGSLKVDMLTDEELSIVARDRESTAMFGWKPYMHNPVLSRWLHRVEVPTLVIWGDRDGIVTPKYGERLAHKLPNAHFRTIAGAGHYPQIERPIEVVSAIEEFISDVR